MAFSDPYEQWKAMGRPGGSFSAWQGGQRPMQETAALPAAPVPMQNYLSGVGGSDAAVAQANAAYAQGQRGSDPNQIFQPGQLAQMRAGAANSSEDYARFSDQTMAGWEQYRQPGSMKYRSMRGAPGLFDKPTECPPGQGPSGPNETDPCTSVGYGGGGGAPGVQQPGAPAAQGQDWMQQLQQYMGQLNQPQAGTGMQRPMGETAGGIGLPQLMQPYQAPQSSATAGLLSQGMAKPQTGAGLAGSLGTGWSGGQDGLAQMMAKRQKTQGQTGTVWWT